MKHSQNPVSSEPHTNKTTSVIITILQNKKQRPREGEWLMANVTQILSSMGITWTPWFEFKHLCWSPNL